MRNSSFEIILCLTPCLPVSVNNKFGGRKGVQSHRPPGMDLLGTDSNLCPESELKPVRESGRGIHINGRRINPV